MSGYGPFSWSYGLSVLKTIAEPTWHFKRQQEPGTTDVTWTERDKKQHLRPRLPVATYIGWALLRITLCVDIALINELVGYFVLNAVRIKMYTFETHRNPQAVAFIGAIGGACSALLVFIIDAIYSTPETRDRWPMLDPDQRIPTTANSSNAQLVGLVKILGENFKPAKASGSTTEPSLALRGDPKDAKNMTEGGPITLRKLRVHAFMRIIIWSSAAAIAGAAGTAIWFAKDGKKGTTRLTDRIITGVIVQLVGVAVIVVGPTILQILYLLVELGETATKYRKAATADP